MTNNNNRNRQCSRCDASEPETKIYDITLPPDIPRGLYCKTCMQVLIDNSIQKNAAKNREINRQLNQQ